MIYLWEAVAQGVWSFESTLYCNESQTELYLEYIEVVFLMLSSDFHEEFAYNGQHDQRQRKGVTYPNFVK